ncbi:MAG: sigma factor-like helix-turn-helix DNA-binding protein [Candidatus Binataceae bacterium]
MRNLLMRARDDRALLQAIENPPAEYREPLVLRELEGLSYKQIAEVAAMPIGTVMPRLARARKRIMAELRVMAELRGVARKGEVA